MASFKKKDFHVNLAEKNFIRQCSKSNYKRVIKIYKQVDSLPDTFYPRKTFR